MSVNEPIPTQVANRETANILYQDLNSQAVYNNATTDVLNATVQPQVLEQPTSVNEQLLAKVIPAEAELLSSGVYVVFNRLNRSMSTDLTIKTFNNVNVDKKGNLISDNLSTRDQMNMAKSISEYHSTLIMQGVILWGDIDEYIAKLELPSNWVKKLFRSGLVDQKYYDVNDENDVEFLFLRYYAFQSEEDWALLSQRTLNT